MAKWFALAVAAAAVLTFVSWRFLSGPESPTVVVYVSHDQVFSEPIVKDFERDTGVKVRAIYDTEETKSTGRYEPPDRREKQSTGGCLLGE
jgi:iron(III) transport system substrate-binding protein